MTLRKLLVSINCTIFKEVDHKKRRYLPIRHQRYPRCPKYDHLLFFSREKAAIFTLGSTYGGRVCGKGLHLPKANVLWIFANWEREFGNYDAILTMNTQELKEIIVVMFKDKNFRLWKTWFRFLLKAIEDVLPEAETFSQIQSHIARVFYGILHKRWSSQKDPNSHQINWWKHPIRKITQRRR